MIGFKPVKNRGKVEFYTHVEATMPSHFVLRLRLIIFLDITHGVIFGLFTPSCHSSDHCSNLLLWYYWHPAHEGQLVGTGLSDKYLSTSLVIFPAVLSLPL